MSWTPAIALAHAGLALCVACLTPAALAAGCLNEEPAEPKVGPASIAPADAATSRKTLKDLVQAAVARSQAVGAASLLAEAAVSDVQEARSGRLPQANLSGALNHVNSRTAGSEAMQGRQAQTNLSVGAPLYDAGRTSQLTTWRSHLAEAALLGQMSAQEQVALQTVSLAIDRNRYRLQSQVYGQFARRMSCLVQALEQIVSADRGRTSELVQARKNLQQAELSQVQAQAAVRQVEVRLRRFVGDALPPLDGMSAQLIQVPALNELLASVPRASDIMQLEAQADAQESLAGVVALGNKPQVNWQLGTAQVNGVGRTGSWSAGLTYTVPLYSPGQGSATEAARKRAQAARLQYAEALESRKSRTADVHDQAASAFDRARKVCDVLRNSELVRNYTLQQWQQLGRRSLFDLMSAEGDHYSLRVSYVNSISDGQLATALLYSLGQGVSGSLQ
jgi:outer membrane protein, adhesin transport system